MQVIVDGLMTNYLKAGKGKTIVMLHGWGDSAATYQTLAKDLSSKYEVLALDLPGFGGTQKPSDGWGLEDYAKFVSAWLKKIDKKSYALIGHSHGGAVSIYGVAHKLLKVEKLVLLASAGIRNPKKAGFKLKLGKALVSPLPKSTRHNLRKNYYKSIGSEALLFPELEPTFRKIVAKDISADTSLISQPTLLIYGEQDKETPPAYGQQFATTIKNSKLLLVSDAGHFVHHDQPQTVSAKIEEFLK